VVDDRDGDGERSAAALGPGGIVLLGLPDIVTQPSCVRM